MEKMAFDKGSNQSVPVVVTDKKTVRGVNDLINLANNVVSGQQKVIDKKKDLDSVKSKISDARK
jgi:hypothetical protein